MKKFLALMLAVVLVLGCFCGCSDSESYKEDTVLTVNGAEVSFDEYCYWLGYSVSYLQYIYSYYSGSSEVDWDATCPFDETMTNYQWCVSNAKETVVRSYIVEAMFNDRELSLSDEETQELEDTMTDAAESWCGDGATQDQLCEYLKSVNINYDYYKKNLRMNLVSNALFADMYGENGEKLSESDIVKYADENGYVNANHILIMTVDESTNEALSDSEVAKRTQQAQDIAAELQGISDPDELMTRFAEIKAEYCDDLKYRATCSNCSASISIHKSEFDAGKLYCPSCGTLNDASGFTYSDNADGYLFTEGTMVTEFYEACLALSEYQVSDPVKSSYGYHIIVRLPMDTTKTVTSYGSDGTTLGATVADEQFSDLLDEKSEAAEVEYVNEFTDESFRDLFTEDGFELMSFDEFSGDADAAEDKKSDETETAKK